MKLYLDLFTAFLKMGFFAIGGGYAFSESAGSTSMTPVFDSFP